MFELNTISDCVDGDVARAIAIVETIAAYSDSISESVIQLYMVGMPVHPEVFENEVAFARGLGLLDVSCDCNNEEAKRICFSERTRHSEYYSIGTEHVDTELGEKRRYGVGRLKLELDALREG